MRCGACVVHLWLGRLGLYLCVLMQGALAPRYCVLRQTTDSLYDCTACTNCTTVVLPVPVFRVQSKRLHGSLHMNPRVRYHGARTTRIFHVSFGDLASSFTESPYCLVFRGTDTSKLFSVVDLQHSHDTKARFEQNPVGTSRLQVVIHVRDRRSRCRETAARGDLAI